MLTGLGLGAYAAVCARARRVLSNSSGPAHLAAAVGASVLGVYFSGWTPGWPAPWGGEVVDVEDGWPTVEDVLERGNL